MHHNRIAWSRSGLLAYIDGNLKVNVTWLQCTDGEEWEFVRPVHVQAAGESTPVDLSWSTTNFDLAIADELGRVNIVTINNAGSAINQIVASAVRDQRQRPVELDRIIGVHWLDSEKNLIIPRSHQDGSAKPWDSVSPLGPFHPVKMRNALVAVNGNGMLRLLVQMPDSQYAEVDALMPCAQYVSHASFCQVSPDRLLVILANGDNSIMVYEAQINWKPENLESKQHFVNVSVHPVTALPLPTEYGTLRKLLAFRTIEGNAFSKDVTIRVVYPKTVVEYCLQSSEEPLHQSFFDLFSASDPVPPSPYGLWQMTKSNIESGNVEIIECLANRLTLLTIYANGESKSESLISSVSALQLDKAGLLFNPRDLVGAGDEGSTAISICVSPTMSCAAVYYDGGSQVEAPKLISMQPRGADIDLEGVKYMALSLATTYACTVFNSEQCDDVMKLCWEILHESAVAKHAATIFDCLAADSQRLLNVQLTVPEDPHKIERLVVIPSPSQRWLSFLIALGTSSGWKRTPGCYAELSLLHLQILAFGLTWTLKRVTQRSRAQNVEQLRLEIQASQFHLSSMLGPVRWATDLIVRICQELYDVSSSSGSSQVIGHSNVFMALLLSSVARYLLRYFLRVIRSLSATAKNLAEQETRLNAKISQASQAAKDTSLAHELRVKLASPSNYTATRTLKKLVAQLQASPVKFDAFEKILVSIEEGIKALAAKVPLSEEQRKQIDGDLIKTAQIPNVLTPVVNSLIETSKSVLFTTTDIPSLYFHDASWLALDTAVHDETIDGLRKRLILPQEQMQLCSRCGMKSVLASDQAKQSPQWLVLFQRHCVCGGSWIRTRSN